MKTKLTFVLAFLSFALAASAQNADTDTWAKGQLDKSSRHREWVDVKNGSRTVHCYIVYPEVKDPAPAVIVIHEIFGLTPWARVAADEVAAAGYIAIAPDLLTGAGPNGGDSKDFASTDDAMAAIHNLPPDQITGDLNAAADYVKTLSAANGKLAVGGFCWGGGQTFRFAAHRADLKAAFVFYGSPPSTDDMKAIQCPVYGFYAGNDARISASVPETKRQMKGFGKTYEPVDYEGAGHGFMRMGDLPGAKPDNKKAHDEAWARLKSLLGNL